MYHRLYTAFFPLPVCQNESVKNHSHEKVLLLHIHFQHISSTVLHVVLFFDKGQIEAKGNWKSWLPSMALTQYLWWIDRLSIVFNVIQAFLYYRHNFSLYVRILH